MISETTVIRKSALDASVAMFAIGTSASAANVIKVAGIFEKYLTEGVSE